MSELGWPTKIVPEPGGFFDRPVAPVINTGQIHRRYQGGTGVQKENAGFIIDEFTFDLWELLDNNGQFDFRVEIIDAKALDSAGRTVSANAWYSGRGVQEVEV